jgi:two-component system sensor histidine kinase KdpD
MSLPMLYREPVQGARAYIWAAGAPLACTLVALGLEDDVEVVNLALVYLLGIVAVSLRCSRSAMIVCAAFSVAALGFFFVPPRRTVMVDDPQYLLTFALMLAIAFLISRLKDDLRTRAEQQAELSIKAETERLRSTLLASISHDLRTPLARLTGASSLLIEGHDSMDAARRYALATSVVDQTRRLSEHVDKILEMTRLESGSIELHRDWNALSEIAEAALASIEYKLAEHRLVIDLPADLPLVRVDPALVAQVIANLLENAARHTPAGTLIRLRAQVENGELLTCVDDFGAELAAADFERVFEKFHRRAEEQASAGPGLGLSICRAIVTLHGGRIWAEQIAGGGASFRFALAIEQVPEVPLEAP